MEIFEGNGLSVIQSGRKYLGEFIGKHEDKREYFKKITDGWIEELRMLANLAKSEPQAAYVAFLGGLKCRFDNDIRRNSGLCELLQSVDDVIDNEFIPAISGGHYCTPDERKLISLPVCSGGLDLPVLSELAITHTKLE